MKSKLMSQAGGERSYVLVLEEGEEAFASIRGFAEENRIDGASVTAIGAFSGATLGFFEFGRKRYREIPVDEQCEVLSILGDIAVDEAGQASPHLHAVLGLSDGSTRGGHLLSGRVRPTLEIVITETASHMRRRKVPDLGIALIDV